MFTIIATVGIILAALYILLMYQRTMHGPARGVRAAPARTTAGPPARPAAGATAVPTAARAGAGRCASRDLDRRELAVVAPLVALIIVLGVYPQPLLDLIEPAVAATMSDLGGTDR